jgi:hypothetical protein
MMTHNDNLSYYLTIRGKQIGVIQKLEHRLSFYHPNETRYKELMICLDHAEAEFYDLDQIVKRLTQERRKRNGR